MSLILQGHRYLDRVVIAQVDKSFLLNMEAHKDIMDILQINRDNHHQGR